MVSSHYVRTIYEDDDLLVLDKPTGLVVDKSDTQQTGTLEDILLSEFKVNLERGGIVHRLDKDTSGVILVAKTQEALDNLQAQFKDRKTKKEYLALVHGLVEAPGKVDAAIGRNPVNRQKFTVISTSDVGSSPKKEKTSVGTKPTFEVFSAKEAVTEYEPMDQLTIDNGQLTNIFADFNKIQARKLERMKYNEFTLLRCFPKTGRTHQIRVHLKYINHPIVSDETYVGRKMYRLDHRWCPRQFLHAARIGFYHPKSDKWMEIESELPVDLKEALARIKN